VAGGVLASLILTGGAAVAFSASPSEPTAKDGPVLVAPTPAAAVAAPRRERASRGGGRSALPPVRYVPRTVAVGKPFTGLASWYGPRFHGRRTANGERFDADALTAASRTLPFGTRLRVCRAERCVVVRINDRGPYVGGRVLDLSRGARNALGYYGVARVTATPVRTKRVPVHRQVRRAPVKVSLKAASVVAPSPLPVAVAAGSGSAPVGAGSALLLGILGLAGCGARLRHLRS